MSEFTMRRDIELLANGFALKLSDSGFYHRGADAACCASHRRSTFTSAKRAWHEACFRCAWRLKHANHRFRHEFEVARDVLRTGRSSMKFSIDVLERTNGRRRVERGVRRVERMRREGLARAERAQADQRKRILETLGLEKRRSIWGIVLPGVGLLGAGALLGAAAILLFAPRVVSSRIGRHEAVG